MHWPRFLSWWSEWNYFVQLVKQHHTDIQRLWKRVGQTPEYGGPGGGVGLNVGAHVPGTSGASAGTGQTGDTGSVISSGSAIVSYPTLAKTLDDWPIDTSKVVAVYSGTPGSEVKIAQVRAFNKFATLDADTWIWLEKSGNSGHVYVTTSRCA